MRILKEFTNLNQEQAINLLTVIDPNNPKQDKRSIKVAVIMHFCNSDAKKLDNFAKHHGKIHEIVKS